MELKFYDVDKEYIKYLKETDSKIPDISYDNHDKFVCGIVFTIGDINYFAPISSFNIKQNTNMLIYNENGEAKSSIRFSFMFPADNSVLKAKDFSAYEYKYKRFLMMELKYCKDNFDRILKMAKKVYKIGTSKNHPLKKNCCDFKLLEKRYLEYTIMNQQKEALKEVAVTVDRSEQGISVK